MEYKIDEDKYRIKIEGPNEEIEDYLNKISEIIGGGNIDTDSLDDKVESFTFPYTPERIYYNKCLIEYCPNFDITKEHPKKDIVGEHFNKICDMLEKSK